MMRVTATIKVYMLLQSWHQRQSNSGIDYSLNSAHHGHAKSKLCIRVISLIYMWYLTLITKVMIMISLGLFIIVLSEHSHFVTGAPASGMEGKAFSCDYQNLTLGLFCVVTYC